MVVEILSSGAQSVLVIESPSATAPTAMLGDSVATPEAQPSVESTVQPAAKPEPARMIPFVSQYIDEVKLSERKILVDWLCDY